MLAWSAEVWTAIAACAQALGVLGALWYAASQVSAAKDLARSQRREQVRDQLDQVWFVEVDVAFHHVRVLDRRLANPRSSEELAEAAVEANRVLTNTLARTRRLIIKLEGSTTEIDQLVKATHRLEPGAAMTIGELDVLALRKDVNQVVLDLLDVVPLSYLGPSEHY
jgi:hypothetical protein